jgi:hypothetical protein
MNTVQLPDLVRSGGNNTVISAGAASNASDSSSWSNAVAWLFILLFVCVLVGLIVWWVLAITFPRKCHDREVRDLHSRDICAAGNVTVGCNLNVGGLTSQAAATIKALSLPPVTNSSSIIVLDGTQSSVLLTSTLTAAVSVTLPQASANSGLIIAVFNESASSSFNVSPDGTDTIEGVSAPVSELSSAVFISMGALPTGLGAWKQII